MKDQLSAKRGETDRTDETGIQPADPTSASKP
jgi:hypothetical protein